MAGDTKYTTKQQAVIIKVGPPATASSTPPLNHNIDLNTYKCTVKSTASPVGGSFPPGTLLHVVKVELWSGLAGPHNWQQGFNASSTQQSVQVDQVTGEEEEG